MLGDGVIQVFNKHGLSINITMRKAWVEPRLSIVGSARGAVNIVIWLKWFFYPLAKT